MIPPAIAEKRPWRLGDFARGLSVDNARELGGILWHSRQDAKAQRMPGGLIAAFAFRSSPYRIVSASEKIGKYSAISTNATKIPMKIMMAGSISDSTAVIRVLTSSS